MIELLFGEILRLNHTSKENTVEDEQIKFTTMGQNIGWKLCEKLAAKNAFSLNEPLEKVKFLCKEVWECMFSKKMGTVRHRMNLYTFSLTTPHFVDKLQTNHRGVFILSDNKFKWLNRFASDDPTSILLTTRLMSFICGVIKGVLENLGMATIVTVEAKSFPSCTFSVKVL
jgi:hypothetical protein